MKRVMVRLYWVLSQQIGIDFRKLLRFIPGFVRYFRDLLKINWSTNTVPVALVPCVHDFSEQGGAAQTEYFWQDLLVARLIYQESPKRHIDIGSRVDGFVAHVASFRTIEVCDVRPIEAQIPGVVFRQLDLMAGLDTANKYDSVSCLHALEHFGLGRYGDPLDLNGDKIGFRNISSLVEVGGLFYLSVPIGKPRLEFNANRVYHPEAIVAMAAENGLVLHKFFYYKDRVLNFSEVEVLDSSWSDLADCYYGLGLFVFRKLVE